MIAMPAPGKKVGLVLLASVVSLTLGLAWAPPAQAHEDCVFHGQDKGCNHGTGYPAAHTGHYVDGCDGEVDGNRVRTHFNLSNVSGGPLIGSWAPSQGCAHDYQSPLFGVLQRQRICEENASCSGWLDH